jgi:hypothetical protein
VFFIACCVFSSGQKRMLLVLCARKLNQQSRQILCKFICVYVLVEQDNFRLPVVYHCTCHFVLFDPVNCAVV